MTAVPRVEDLPTVVLAEDTEEDASHWTCCEWQQVLARGERLYAFCGQDITDDEVADDGEEICCQTCVLIEGRAICGENPRTGNCWDCPQDLFLPG